MRSLLLAKMHVARNNFSFSPVDVARTRDETGQDFSTRPVNFKIIAG